MTQADQHAACSSDVKFTGYPSGVSVMDWWEEEPEIGDPGLIEWNLLGWNSKTTGCALISHMTFSSHSKKSEGLTLLNFN